MIHDKEIKKYILLITYAILLFVGISHLEQVGNFIVFIFKMFMPLIIGFCIAFIFNILLKFYEEKLLKKIGVKHKKFIKVKRIISIILTYLSVILLFVGLLYFIIPAFTKSISTFISKVPHYISNVQNWLYSMLIKLNLDEETWNHILSNWSNTFKNWEKVSQSLTSFLSNSIMSLCNFTVNLTGTVLDFFIGIIFSIYMLFSKEKLSSILKKITYALFNRDKAEKVIKVAQKANIVFQKFIGGQLTEAFILGILCFIGTWILCIPYAPLVSVLMGVTSVLPIVGAYIGTITSALIIFMENPIKAVVFVIFILCLQQFEGNIIYPKVVGNAIGLSGFWVFVAIVVGGNLFGVLGILISVPLTALIYMLFSEFINNRLKEKKLKDNIEIQEEQEQVKIVEQQDEQ